MVAAGIYKITFPSGKFYGSSISYVLRRKAYKYVPHTLVTSAESKITLRGGK